MSMERMTATEEVQEDIDINTKEGLQAFSRYTEDAYNDLLEQVKMHSSESSHAQLEKASQLYETLKEKLEAAFAIKEDGADVDESLTDEIQAHYNELLDILDSIENEESVEELVITEVPVEKEVVVPVMPIISTPPQEAIAESEESEVDVIPEEEKVIENSMLGALKEKAEALIDRAEHLLSKYQEITEAASTDAVLNVGQHYYKQLGVTAERARTTLENIKQHSDKEGKVTELIAEHLEDSIDEISDNLDQLDKGLGGFFEKSEEVSLLDTKKTANGAIEVVKAEEPEEKIVPITLVKKLEPEVPIVRKNSAIHNATMRPPVERVEQAFRTEWGGVISKVTAIPRYKNFIAYTFPSPVQFEAMLRREIQRIEAPSKFDAVFGFNYKSAFYDLLRTMTVEEISKFDSQPRDVIRKTLDDRDIKYEVYLDWIDSLHSMLTLTHAHPNVTFGELFVRAELETLLQHDEQVAA